MKSFSFYLCLIAMCFCSCIKEQYKGNSLSYRRQRELSDLQNNYHVKETTRVLNKNESEKEKRQKLAEKRRIALAKMNSKSGTKYRKRRSLEFDYY
ncbi:hypothetical protein [Sporocytophaga myxococcoides]|uniref:hypothetical protein n=1 Tax=Sporocytophaga myxococcoides TaxID=153721 RepID=UPI0012E0A5C0|nr:hypothetical protein [Sporocytophaga myxococcoides]